MLGDGHSMRNTYSPILTIRIPGVSQHVAANPRSNGSGVPVKRGIRKGSLCARRKFSLEAKSQLWSLGSDRTNLEDFKNPVQVQFPGRNPAFIALRMHKATDRISFTQLEDLPLYLSHDSTIRAW